MKRPPEHDPSAGAAASSISVIIPAFNSAQTLSRCLTALASSTRQPLETIVVDDGSTEPLRQTTDAFGVRLIRISAGPRGPAHARNAGATAAAGSILLFIDADVLVHSDTVDRVAQSFATHSEIAAVFGSYDDEPATPDFVSQFKNLFHHFVHQQANADAETFWSGCGAVKRDVFLAEGGFDDSRYSRPSIEDIELGYRLRGAGHRIHLNKDVQVKHLKRWTLRNLVRTDILDRGVPWTSLLMERRRMPNDLNLRVAQRVSALLAYSMPLYAAIVGLFDLRLPIVAPLLIACGLIVALNYRLYAFFARKRGLGFALAAFPMHLFYYAYALAGLVLGVAAFLTTSRRSRVPAGAA